MNYTARYETAGMTLEFISDFLMSDGPSSGAFRQEDAGTDTVPVRINLCDELPARSGRPIFRGEVCHLYRNGQELINEIFSRETGLPAAMAVYPMEGDGGISVYAAKSRPVFYSRTDNFWSVVDLPYQLLKRNSVVFHSSTVDFGGQAILFAGPSGIGKSTQAALWEREEAARILNGDKAAVRMKDGRAMAFGVPFCGTSGICRKYELPLRAIVLPEKSEENDCLRLMPSRSIPRLLSNIFGHSAIPGCTEKILAAVLPVLESVPVFLLPCTPDERAVKKLKSALMFED